MGHCQPRRMIRATLSIGRCYNQGPTSSSVTFSDRMVRFCLRPFNNTLARVHACSKRTLGRQRNSKSFQ